MMNALGAVELVITILYLAVLVLVIAGGWKVFSKAGQPGWAILIPIYNVIVLLKIARRPLWWFFILFLIVPGIILEIDVARNFGKGGGFAAGLIFLPVIFIPILGFGSAQYQAAAAPPAAA